MRNLCNGCQPTTVKQEVKAKSTRPTPLGTETEEKEEGSAAVATEQIGCSSGGGGASSQGTASVAGEYYGGGESSVADSNMTYNGGVGPGYKWSQTVKEVVLYITASLPEGTSAKLRGKDIDCRITRKHLFVGVRGRC